MIEARLFLMMPQLLEELFQAAGRSVHDYLSLVPVDPLYRLQFGDVKFEPGMDREKTRAKLNSCSRVRQRGICGT